MDHDELTAKILSGEATLTDGIPAVGIPIEPIEPVFPAGRAKDGKFYLMYVDKEHHAVHAMLIEPSLEAIRAIVAEELAKMRKELVREVQEEIRRNK